MPYQHAFPPPQGLYDPRHEHDACGVAFVATLTGVASHDIVARSLTALRNLEHRGAAGAEPNSGDGAGILMQIPDTFLRAVASEAGLRAARGPRVRRGHGLPARRRRGGRQDPQADRGDRARGGALGPRLARRPDPAGLPRLHRAGRDAAVRPAVRHGVRPAPQRHGAGAARLLPAPPRREGHRRLLPVAVVAHAGLQGHAHHRAARRVLPGPARRADRLGPVRGPLALLDQHLPELAALAPVPVHRPQRRDQHRDGQPQLDAGPRGAALLRPDPGRPRAALPDLHAGCLGLRVVRRGARAPAHGRTLAAPTRCS